MSDTVHTVVLVDPMDGVRDGLRWVLAADTDIVVVAEAHDVATAARAPGQVVVSALVLADGVAADLVGLGRPVVVHTWLPADERPPGAADGAAAVVRHGTLRARLAAEIRRAAGQSSG
ncbi:MAG TPA: hypothetical protein VM307_08570 [Egibacteraceae bacterium]|nr:hypothetical protein [Egibacteraceae bacterium]